MTCKLEKPYTDFERADFIVEYNHKRGMLIEETEDGTLYALEKNEIMVNGVAEINPNYEEELSAKRENLFNREFFQTSLGWIRRQVNMKDGSKKDFLSDELIDITKEINRLTSIIGAKDKEIASANEAIRILEKEKINVTIELEKMNDDIERKNKYEALNALIGKNEKEIDNQIKILFKRFGSGIGVFCSLNFFKEALEELKSFDMLDKGVPGIHSDTVKFLLKRNICICGEKITDKESRARHLNELMMALPPYSIGNSISHFATEISGIVTAFGDFEAELTNSIKRINELEKQIDDANNECREIENSLADTDKVNILRTRKENAERNINNEKNKANSAQIDKIHFEHELNEEVNKRNNLINQHQFTGFS